MTTKPLPTEAEQALIEGRKIEAIKHVRELEGLGLKAAKERVETAQLNNPERYPPPRTTSGGLVWIIVILALAWMLWRWLGR